jgi:hypothetical protein
MGWHMSKLYGTLTPAYGRDYDSADKALADLNAGKDFVINNPEMSTYCSIRDMADGSTLQLRYKKLTMVCIVTKVGNKCTAEIDEDEVYAN